jgi:hypothetical protein
MRHLKAFSGFVNEDREPEETPVEFYYNEVNKDLFAFFPEDKENGKDLYGCYSLDGEHSSCSLQYVNSSRIAEPGEREKLINVLRNRGYKLKILN